MAAVQEGMGGGGQLESRTKQIGLPFMSLRDSFFGKDASFSGKVVRVASVCPCVHAGEKESGSRVGAHLCVCVRILVCVCV